MKFFGGMGRGPETKCSYFGGDLFLDSDLGFLSPDQEPDPEFFLSIMADTSQSLCQGLSWFCKCRLVKQN